VKLSHLTLPPALSLALLASTAVATTVVGFHPMLSADSKNCYLDAVSDADHNRTQPALAKLESLLMDKSVTVGIDKSTLNNAPANFSKAVEHGINIWRDALPDSPYVLGDNTTKRPIVLVKFVKTIDNEGGDLQGMIEAEHEFRWTGSTHTNILNSTMYIVTKTEGRYLTENEVAEVTAHELGHLLGLTDASAPKGLMGPFVAGEPRLAPSSSELDAVNEFRQMVRDEIAKIETSAINH
jgi:hypothetical protein